LTAGGRVKVGDDDRARMPAKELGQLVAAEPVVERDQRDARPGAGEQGLGEGVAADAEVYQLAGAALAQRTGAGPGPLEQLRAGERVGVFGG
jgi:hypothetical protein